MKRILCVLLLCSLIVSCCGCSDLNAMLQRLEQYSTEPNEAAADAEYTAAEAENATQSSIETAAATEASTEPETTAAPEMPLYTTELSYDTPIYDRASFLGNFVQYVETTSVYTIMEEAYDESGNLWGRLKSGLGWVMLTRYSKFPYLVTLSSHCVIYKAPTANSTFVDYVGTYGDYTIMEESTDAQGNLWGRLKSGKGWVLLSEASLTPWKSAYLDYIETLDSEKEYCDYRLVYVDSDDIPELFISGSCEASGSIICSYQGGEVVATHLRRLGGASYIPYSGLVHNCNGNMGYYTTDIYRLTDSGFVSLFWGEEEQSYETVTNEAGEQETISRSSFYIGSERTEVSEEAYLAAQSEIFDSTAAERLYIYNDSRMLSYTSIRERIRNW